MNGAPALLGAAAPAGPGDRTARRPPPGLPGLEPRWSRLVEAPDADGIPRTWHVLDSGAAPAAGRGTVLCVHGNPTWSYLWRDLLARPPQGWRVVAVDQLGMGWSARPDRPRTLAQRIDDLSSLTDVLGLRGPVVTLAHDWGGPVSLGWALAHQDQLGGVVLANTAVHQPPGAAAPALIRLARTPALRSTICVRTPSFVRATTALSWPPLPAAVRDAFAAPYDHPDRRRAVGDFVADIPLEPQHPSAGRLDDIAADLAALRGIPALLLWGPRDPVFSDRYLRDLLGRLPHAAVHRFEGAAHLVTEDAPAFFDTVRRWLADLPGMDPRPDRVDQTGPGTDVARAGDRAVAAGPRHRGAAEPMAPPWGPLAARAADTGPAVVELGVRRGARSVSWAALAARVEEIASGLAASGVRPGDRVALLVRPGADLTAALYACWRAGAVIVVADAGLGLPALGRALRGAGPDWVIGSAAGLAAARALRVPGRRIAAGPTTRALRRALGAPDGLADLARRGRGAGVHARPQVGLPAADPTAECAVVFTSGATGPPKGVVYRQGQVAAQLAVLRATYDLRPEDRLVAAFAPFALYGVALGLASAVPATDVTAPATLTAAALADAAAAVGATVLLASPAALRNVVATADRLDQGQRAALARVRLVLSFGAPVPLGLLQALAPVLPSAQLRTPYGMTEALPVTDVSLDELEKVGRGNGVCVGSPVAGVDVRISALTAGGAAEGPLTAEPGVTGEVCVAAAHVKDRYDRLWATERDSARNAGWHRTGDVGHLDPERRLWVEGRLAHVVTTAAGVVTPVGVEQAAEELAGVRAAAAVGVGPAGSQQLVVVVVPEPPPRSGRGLTLAEPVLAAAVRAAVSAGASAGGPAGGPAGLAVGAPPDGLPAVAAVLVTDRLPVDIRHNAKIDRLAVAKAAAAVLAGR